MCIDYYCEIKITRVSVNVVNGEVLHIVKISRLHMGAYLCIASNEVPPSVSARVDLRVQCKFGIRNSPHGIQEYSQVLESSSDRRRDENFFQLKKKIEMDQFSKIRQIKRIVPVGGFFSGQWRNVIYQRLMFLSFIL